MENCVEKLPFRYLPDQKILRQIRDIEIRLALRKIIRKELKMFIFFR